MAGSSRDTSSGYDAFAITPSDVTIIPACRGLFVGGAGNIAVVMAGGTSVTFTGVVAGILPIQVSQVKATGTTATNIVALY